MLPLVPVLDRLRFGRHIQQEVEPGGGGGGVRGWSLTVALSCSFHNNYLRKARSLRRH